MLREVPVDGYDATPWNGITDYCFYNPSGDVITVVEAKRTCRNPREGEEQLRHYVTEIAKRQPDCRGQVKRLLIVTNAQK